MALDFPTSPSLNDTYTLDSRTWRWNGVGWALMNSGIAYANTSLDYGLITTAFDTTYDYGDLS